MSKQDSKNRWTVRPSSLDHLFVILGVGFGFALSVYAYYLAYTWEESLNKLNFEKSAVNTVNGFEDGIERYKTILKSLTYLYNASDFVSRKEFSEFVRETTQTDKSFRALQWLPRVTGSERDSLERDIQKEGFTNFQITQKNLNGTLERRSRHEEYFPVVYLEPFTGNEVVLGYDPSSDSKRTKSLADSRDSGRMVAVEPLRLIQEQADELGFLVFAPVYNKGSILDSVDARRTNLTGFYLAVFNVKAFIQGALGALKTDDMIVHVFDQPGQGNYRLLYSSAPPGVDGTDRQANSIRDPESRLHYKAVLDNSGIKWTVICESPKGSSGWGSRSWLPAATLMCGLLLTALVNIYITFLKLDKMRSDELALLQSKARREIECEAHAKSEAMITLEERELQFRNIFENSMDGIMLTRPDGTILKANSAACDALGWTEEELMRIGRDGIVDAGDPKLKNALETRATCSRASGVVTFKRKNGEIFPAQVSSGIFQDETGNTFSTVVFRDISKEKQYEEVLKTHYLQTKALIDNIPDLVWLKDSQSHFIIINEAFARSCGTPSDQIAGKTDYDVWPEELAAIYIADDFEVMKSGVTKIVEEPVADIGNAIGWIETIKTPIFDSNGKILGTVGTARDITARVNSEQRRKLLATAVEQSGDSIMITDPHGVIQYVNPAFESISGYSRDEAIGQNPRILKSGEHDEEFYKFMWDSISGGRMWSGLLKNRRKNGLIAYENATISPVKDESGVPVAYVSVNRDVTQERLMQEQLAQSQKMEAIGTLAGGIAHDFNNIIFGIIGYAELALDHVKSDEAATSYVNEIIVASERAGQMVKQILTFSRRSQSEKTIIDVVPLIKEALKFLRGAIDASIQIHSDIEPDIPMIYADPTQVYQVLMNLCANAAFAMKNSNGVLAVTLACVELEESFTSMNSSLEPGKYVRLTVTDTGEGMTRDTIKRIFEPYFTTKDVGEGTGMGLSVVDGIVRNHGGTIDVWSEPGKGSRFSVYFPPTHSHEVLLEDEETEVQPQGHGRILWVEDEINLMRMTAETLQRRGFSVSGYSDPEKALETFKLAPEHFDLVITDLSMPKMSGYDLAREIKKIRPEFPVILCTGYGKLMSTSRVKESGITRVVSKPVSRRDLILAIRQTLDAKST